jgi:hypothetical protein
MKIFAAVATSIGLPGGDHGIVEGLLVAREGAARPGIIAHMNGILVSLGLVLGPEPGGAEGAFVLLFSLVCPKEDIRLVYLMSIIIGGLTSFLPRYRISSASSDSRRT